ncbi:MAG: CsbD family protein [Actinomycetota bacterium]|nr:CsbD family protein [Actinomycetota bacterium]
MDLNKLRGLGDKFIGLAKETVGAIANNERLQDEGQAQQDRASEQLKALRKEAEAEAKDAKAELLEGEQRAAQRAKERAS